MPSESSSSYSESGSESESHSYSENEESQVQTLPSPKRAPIHIGFLYSLPPSLGHPYVALLTLLNVPIVIGAVVFIYGHGFQQDTLYPIFGGWRKFGYPFLTLLLNLMAMFVTSKGDSKVASPLKASIPFAAAMYGVCLLIETGELFNNEKLYYKNWCTENSKSNNMGDIQGCSKWMEAAGAICTT